MEIRHPRFLTDAFVTMLRRFEIALVTEDTAGRWPLVPLGISTIGYPRLHGNRELYVCGYLRLALQTWSARIAALRSGRPMPGILVLGPPIDAPPQAIHVYLDNDAKLHAPPDASRLAALCGVRAG